MSAELRPCPFCGKNTGYFGNVFMGTKYEKWRFTHNDYCCRVTITTEFHRTKEECIRDWNERAE